MSSGLNTMSTRIHLNLHIIFLATRTAVCTTVVGHFIDFVKIVYIRF